ncbi:hypothetical protein EVAR_10892_1 [Eumeta japonica]|uniref:Retrovirus-related Pol polyprotein from type-1 retrotransposable element R1 n=1 Tax=Eumeta variegata TaxID=151549 RepID=A0A4C1USV7_EUMVA|nr:hypothetical protein EVAR_10892_1 [Eumeta japonica]
MIDALLNFKQQVEQVSTKASALRKDRLFTNEKGHTHRLLRNSKRKNGRIVYADGSCSEMLERRMLSGYGCFRAYLHRFKRDDSPECPSCPGKPEDAEHVFFMCRRFNLQHDELETILNQRIQPKTLVEAMLSTKAAWNTTSTFATEVLTDLRSIERRRARDSN